MCSYYSKWITKLSEKASSSLHASTFPLENEALNSFQRLKDDLAKACLGAMVDHSVLELRPTHYILPWRPFCYMMAGQWHLCPEL